MLACFWDDDKHRVRISNNMTVISVKIPVICSADRSSSSCGRSTLNKVGRSAALLMLLACFIIDLPGTIVSVIARLQQ